MQGTCIECGAENMDINPYKDSPYYGMCFVCQMKALDKETEQERIRKIRGIYKGATSKGVER